MAAPSAPSRTRPLRWVAAAVALAVLGVAAYVWWSMGGRSAPAPSSALVIGKATQLTTDDGLEIDAAISPDGRVVAYAAGPAASLRIYLRPVIGGRTIPLSDSAAAQEIQPRWSPDGSQILFLRAPRQIPDHVVRRVAVHVPDAILPRLWWRQERLSHENMNANQRGLRLEMKPSHAVAEAVRDRPQLPWAVFVPRAYYGRKDSAVTADSVARRARDGTHFGLNGERFPNGVKLC